MHLAAETGTAQSLSESTRHGMVNVVGTTQLLDSLTRAGHVPGHFVLTSSRAVYGEGVWRNADGSTFQPGLRTHAQLEAGKWDHGDGAAHVPNTVAGTHPNPINVYGATKLAQEQILSAWTGSHDTRLSVLRLQNVYGPRQSLSNPYTGIVSLFSRLAREGESIPLYEDGDITRDFVYIDDVVSALVAAIAAPAGRPHAHGRRRQRRPHHDRRPGPRDRALPLGAGAARHRPVPRRRRPARLVHGRGHPAVPRLAAAGEPARRRRRAAGVDRDPARLSRLGRPRGVPRRRRRVLRMTATPAVADLLEQIQGYGAWAVIRRKAAPTAGLVGGTPHEVA